MFCPRCGTRTSDDAGTCALCGMALGGDQTSGTAPAHVTAPAEAGSPVAVVRAVTYGGFWRRLVAVLLDSLLLFFPAATVRVLLGLEPLAVFDADAPASYTAAAFEMGVNWLYAATLICSRARGTLGMLVMDLHVTDLKGDRVSFARATWRYVAQVLTLLTFGAGYLLQLVTPRRQTLHDIVSGTVVVRPRPLHETALAPVMRILP